MANCSPTSACRVEAMNPPRRTAIETRRKTAPMRRRLRTSASFRCTCTGQAPTKAIGSRCPLPVLSTHRFPQLERCQPLADSVHEPALGSLGGDPDGIADGPRVRAPVSDDADAVDAQEWRATVFRIVELRPDATEHRLETEPQKGGDGVGSDLRANDAEHARSDAFGELDEDVPHEAIRHDDVRPARGDVLALHVADEAHRRIPERPVGLLHAHGSLLLLLADAEQGYARLGNPQHTLRIDRA